MKLSCSGDIYDIACKVRWCKLHKTRCCCVTGPGYSDLTRSASTPAPAPSVVTPSSTSPALPPSPLATVSNVPPPFDAPSTSPTSAAGPAPKTSSATAAAHYVGVIKSVNPISRILSMSSLLVFLVCLMTLFWTPPSLSNRDIWSSSAQHVIQTRFVNQTSSFHSLGFLDILNRSQILTSYEPGSDFATLRTWKVQLSLAHALTIPPA